MPCKQCKTRPVIKLNSTNIKLCKSCFLKYFEKKVLGTIRKYDMIKNSKKINILDDEFYNINFNILDGLSKQRRGKFKVFKTKSKKGKTIVSDNIDIISSLILLSEFKNKLRKDLPPIYKNTIRPLYFMHLEEIELYAKLKKLRIKKKKLPSEQKKVMDFINDMEQQYSGTKNNIVKSYIELIESLQ